MAKTQLIKEVESLNGGIGVEEARQLLAGEQQKRIEQGKRLFENTLRELDAMGLSLDIAFILRPGRIDPIISIVIKQ
ncbi:MAG: hypothetical protein A2Z04_06625 [Chloroflexi bacterium RBG_16_57_9]|nr:MAG: hypothetical protein A2Z04_06625 [Chloroflexi bacterium RBG_16_57_9]